MTYQGHVENGTVVLDTPVNLPEGIRVSIAVVEPHEDVEKSMSHSRKKIMEFAGKFTGLPADASVNLDHYLYGHSKKS